MIKAEFKELKSDNSLMMTIQGHANQAEYGKDIVCASVSTLAYTLAEVVGEMYEAEKLQNKPTILLDEGKSIIVCKPCLTSYFEAYKAYEIVQTGLRLLSTTYPQYVETNCFE